MKLAISNSIWFIGAMFIACLQHSVLAQNPAPETAPPIFPKGALISYSSNFFSREIGDQLSATSQPTFSHNGTFVFTWGFYPDFDLTISAPIVTNRFENQEEVGGTGFGDALVLVKYRFYRQDSERGTTQVSITAGPKLPSGSTGLTDSSGVKLPASLQPGSGSIDLFFGFNWTYTGLFNIKRLVADEDFRSLVRTTGTQQSKLGNEFESRFWLSYRPYESKDVRREWFIGPTITWLYSADENIDDIEQNGSGGNELRVGVTTYFGIAPGVHVWLAIDWNVAHSDDQNFRPLSRYVSFGITRQFRFF
jgi:hypothetical protein